MVGSFVIFKNFNQNPQLGYITSISASSVSVTDLLSRTTELHPSLILETLPYNQEHLPFFQDLYAKAITNYQNLYLQQYKDLITPKSLPFSFCVASNQIEDLSKIRVLFGDLETLDLEAKSSLQQKCQDLVAEFKKDLTDKRQLEKLEAKQKREEFNRLKKEKYENLLYRAKQGEFSLIMNGEKIKVCDHAVERFKERFPKASQSEIEANIIENLQSATEISHPSQGKSQRKSKVRFFCSVQKKSNCVWVVAANLSTVITVYSAKTAEWSRIQWLELKKQKEKRNENSPIIANK